MPPTEKLILFISLLVAISINSTCAWAADDLRPGQMYNLAIQGDVDAQYLLGVAYYEGKYHFPQDLSKAEDWLEKAHQGGHELALVKLEEVRQAHSNKKAAQGSNGAQARVAIEANKFGDANLDPRHHRLIEDHPQAMALAETLLQRTLLKSNSARESCSNLEIHTGSELLWAPFYAIPDSADLGGGQIAKDTLRCFAGSFYGLSASAYSVIDVDAMKSAGFSWNRSHAAEECKKPNKAMDADSAGRPLNSRGQVRLYSTGYQIAEYFQDCVIAQIEALVQVLPYWSGNRDPNFVAPRKPLNDAELDAEIAKMLGEVKFGDWTFSERKASASVMGYPGPAHLRLSCDGGFVYVDIVGYPRFWNATPKLNVATAVMDLRIDSGDETRIVGTLTDAPVNSTWRLSAYHESFPDLLKALRSGSRLRAGATRINDKYGVNEYRTHDFSLKGSTAAINEVQSACKK